MTGWLLAALLAQSLDITTSVVKLRQGGCHEANPTLTSVGLTTGPRILALKGGVVAAYTFTWGAERRRHPSLVTTESIVILTSGLVAGVHNLGIHCGGLK